MFKVTMFPFAPGNVYSVKHSTGTSVKARCFLIHVSLHLLSTGEDVGHSGSIPVGDTH